MMVGGLVVVMENPVSLFRGPCEVRRERMLRTKPGLWRATGRGLRTVRAVEASDDRVVAVNRTGRPLFSPVTRSD